MRLLAAADGRVATDLVRKFMGAGLTGCGFAAALAKAEGRIQWHAFADTDPTVGSLAADLTLLFGAAADSQRAAVAVFPELRTPEHVVDLLAVLAADAAWRLTAVPWTRNARADALVGLWWTTPAGSRASVAGFAPLGCMPVVRRAPFVALAVWPGGKSNPRKREKMKRRPDPPDEVGFVDMPPLAPEAHHQTWDATVKRVREIRARPPEGADVPDVAFCLPAACRARLAPLYAP